MITAGEQLAPHTTLKVGGCAEHFTIVSSKEELVEVVREAQQHNWPLHILGGGSNVLVSDTGVTGLVLKNGITGKSFKITGNTVELTVGAGEVLDEIIAYAVAQGWWGLENLSHIPGTVGATPVQNVGAYGVEVKDVIKAVEVFDCQTGEFKTLTTADCAFAYRHSVFKTALGQRYIVTNVTFVLSLSRQPVLTYKDLQARFADAQPEQSAIRAAVIEIRSKKFPDWHTVGTAGSFFKNPIIPKAAYDSLLLQYPELPGFKVNDAEVKIPLGWILDKVLDVRGIRVGRVGTFEGQALVLVNEGGATATEIEMFANKIIEEVKNKTGVAVEWEVTQW